MPITVEPDNSYNVQRNGPLWLMDRIVMVQSATTQLRIQTRAYVNQHVQVGERAAGRVKNAVFPEQAAAQDPLQEARIIHAERASV